tara:strand:+ start:111 stop:587 length:477 start_codon:yes stop_codon:yes gene_type:complete
MESYISTKIIKMPLTGNKIKDKLWLSKEIAHNKVTIKFLQHFIDNFVKNGSEYDIFAPKSVNDGRDSSNFSSNFINLYRHIKCLEYLNDKMTKDKSVYKVTQVTRTDIKEDKTLKKLLLPYIGSLVTNENENRKILGLPSKGQKNIIKNHLTHFLRVT